MNKLKRNFLKYFFEFIIVTFGVALGLILSEWRKNEETELKKQQSIHYIINEIETNKEELSKTVQYHELIKKNIDSISRNFPSEKLSMNILEKGAFHPMKIKGWKGLEIPKLSETAFNNLKLSGIIENYSFESLEEISKVYNQQKYLTELSSSLIEKTVNFNSNTKVSDMMMVLDLLTSDYLQLEKELIIDYNESIEKLKP
ncbi:hypothetical protein [Tenacibaculum sp. UWU-22]|uniref:hypothetical protein n=1 Tax=Tenacibaculum sp. UWU-22 TaxID=3234187 RepID=UPI0034DB695C